MTPWAALWLTGLAIAILLQAGSPPAARIWAGRSIAVLVGVTTLAVISEYSIGLRLGVDEVWFGQPVRTTQADWPGRPAVSTAIAAFLLAAAVALAWAKRRAIRALWLACLAAAAATSWVAVLAYLLDSMDLVDAGQAAGIAPATALGLLLAAWATALTRPDRNPVSWLLAQPNRGSLVRLGSVFLGLPFLVALARYTFVSLGSGADAALAQSAVIGTVIAAAIGLHLVGREQRLLVAVEADRTLLRATSDGMLDPQVLLEAIRDPTGRAVDFRYLMVNHAACSYLGVSEDDLVGRNLLQFSPGIGGSALFARCAQCLTDGEPLILSDWQHYSEFLSSARYYDIRATRAGSDLLTLSWTDVTERFDNARLLAASERRYRRLIAHSVIPTSLNTVDGRFVLVNQAMCDFFGYDTDTLLGKSWQELTAPEYLEQSRAAVEDILADRRDAYRTTKQYIHADGHRIWGDLSLAPLTNSDGEVEYLIRQIVDITEQVESRQRLEEARIRRAEADALAGGLIENSVIATALATLDGRFVQFNQAMCDLVGQDAATLGQMSWQDITASEFLATEREAILTIISGEIDVYRVRKQFLRADGRRAWGYLALSVLRNASGEPQHLIGQIVDITADVEIREQLEEARRLQAVADTRYRRSVDNAAIGMCLITPDGRFLDVNEALCRLFGYDAETLKNKTWQELTAPNYLEADLKKVQDVLECRLESYRMLKQYVHADGHLIWGDLSVSCIRDEHGRVENFVSQIADITTAVQANERNALLNQRITDELKTAAAYVQSILPRGLTGEVSVSSRYLPSQELGGDCFDYSWLDADHLMAYLIDVSGHGIEPALLAVSLQNMLRSRAFTTETLLVPDAVLAELNQQFQMEQHGEHYFTMWYGVYERSTRTLRYANAGAPPAFAFNTGTDGRVTAAELFSNSLPVGAFTGTRFATDSYIVPAGCRILIYSDGASEQVLADGTQLSLTAFRDLTTRLSAAPDFSIDTVVNELRDLTPDGAFKDDFSLIYLTFD